jgi:monofunctional biosynthetic peptidoglycan transglycosylase
MVIRLFEGEGLDKDWVALSAIAPTLPRSVIAAEDNLFCEHSGFDWNALQVVVTRYAEGKRSRGASTISMQTAKNAMLWPGRSLLRKGAEAYVTMWMELLWTKERILEVYLNIAEWAPGIYGAEAAAQHHFGRPAADLTRRQAALLAAVLPNPRTMNAGRPSSWVKQRASTLQRRVGQLGPLLACAPGA